MVSRDGEVSRERILRHFQVFQIYKTETKITRSSIVNAQERSSGLEKTGCSTNTEENTIGIKFMAKRVWLILFLLKCTA